MSDRIVGIDISNRVVRAAEVQLSPRRKPKVLRVGSVEFPEGVIRRGEVLEPKTMAAALRQLWIRSRFRTRRVAIGLAGPKIYVRDATLPKSPVAYMREQLPFLVQDLIPFPVDEAVLDFYPAGESQADDGAVLRGIIVAARKEVVDGVSTAILGARLAPAAMDLTPFGLARILEPVGTARDRVLTIGIGIAVTNLIVTDAGVPRFVRTLPIGDLDMITAISRRLQISHQEAQAVRSRLGIRTPSGEAADLAAVEAVHSAAWDLLSGIRDTVAYYASINPDIPLTSITLTGPGIEFPGFADALSDLVGLPAGSASIDGLARLPKDLADSPDRDRYITAVGIAMGVRR